MSTEREKDSRKIVEEKLLPIFQNADGSEPPTDPCDKLRAAAQKILAANPAVHDFACFVHEALREALEETK